MREFVHVCCLCVAVMGSMVLLCGGSSRLELGVLVSIRQANRKVSNPMCLLRARGGGGLLSFCSRYGS